MQTTSSPSCFKVRFYDAKASRKGAGVRVAYFATREAAEAFASQNRIYTGPCKVEPVEPVSAEQTQAGFINGGLL